MGSICKFAQYEQKITNKTSIKVQVNKIPNKQQFLEQYTYNLQENTDRFEEDFFQQSFNFELLNENLQIAEISSGNLCLPGSSENNSIEIYKNSQTKSIKESSSQIASEDNSNYRKNQQSQFMYKNKKSNFSISALKGILKMPQSNEIIYFQSNEIQSSKLKKVRFRSSDKMTGKRRTKKQEKTVIRNQINKYS